MSGLNLIPNPPVMLLQAAIFVSQVVVVNKLFVKPFRELKRKREAGTVGAEQKSEKLSEEQEKLSIEIKKKMEELKGQLQSFREKERADAKIRRDREVQEAHSELTEFVTLSRNEIQGSLDEERAKLETVTKDLVEDLYRKIIVA